MKAIIHELVEDLQYLHLKEKLLIVGIMLCFGAACFVSGFVTSKYY